jgi:rubrerythrin
MAKKQTVKGGGACPHCGEELKAARVPTDEEYRKAFDRENPGTLPGGSDTASPDQREQLGPLFVCRHCGYNHRDTPTDSAAA